MKTLTVIFTFSIVQAFAQSPIIITTPDSKTFTIEAIVKALEGEGVIIKNISTNQSSGTNQLAQFNDQKELLGMKQGVLMSTGSVRNLGTSNMFSGMTGQVSSGPVTEYDTITMSVPCQKSGFQSNKVVEVENTKSQVTIIDKTEADNKETGWSNYTNQDGALCNYDYVVSEQMETDIIVQSVDSNTNMCSTTYILPKNQAFYTQGGDADLEAELGGNFRTFDACVIELDIIPLGDTLSFRYLFASEEYDEYVCSAFNDAFAFFLSGPGITGKKNMAVLESGDRITVNSINKGNPHNKSCKSINPTFYNKNKGQIPMEFDGFTRTLEIVQKVEAFKTYHLKLVIADASDGIYDSGVFVESESVLSYNKRFVIPFNSNVSSLDKEAQSILLSMTEIANKHDEYVLEISGHTDADGDEDSNLMLAQDRLNTVIDFIQSNGYSLDKIISVNKGETMPIASNFTEEGKRKNRRVEVKLIPSYHVASEEIVQHQVKQEIEMINYPNPTSSITTIEVIANNPMEQAVIEVYDMKGKKIVTQAVENGKTVINTSEWDNGIYVYALLTEGRAIKTNRMVVAR